MKIVTWNVNSIRVRLQAVLDWMGQTQPDVLCLQEIKVTNELFPVDAFEALGYQVAVSGQKTYNGVAIISKYEMIEVETEFPDYDAEGQKRFIAATTGGVRVVNLYVPNGSAPDSPKFVYKLEFIRQLHSYLKHHHEPKELLALTGDFNVAPEPRDVYDTEEMEGEIVCVFNAEVREAVEGWAPLEKLSFDCCGAAGFEIGTKSVVIAGMETHVCVYQTARSLASRGHLVHVVSDAVISRRPENRDVGLELMRGAGAIVTSTEVVLFDLLKGSDAPEFKAISKLVR